MWNPRVFADDARGWQCPFVLCLHPQGCLRRGVRAPEKEAPAKGKEEAMPKEKTEVAKKAKMGQGVTLVKTGSPGRRRGKRGFPAPPDKDLELSKPQLHG